MSSPDVRPSSPLVPAAGRVIPPCGGFAGIVLPPAEPLAQQWRNAMQQARRDPDCARLSTQLMELVGWPDLARLPPELAAPAARVCALLACKRTAGLLVARVLGLPDEDALALLATLRRFGHVRDVPVAGSVPDGTPRPQASATPPALRADSLLGRLWRRLAALS